MHRAAIRGLLLRVRLRKPSELRFEWYPSDSRPGNHGPVSFSAKGIHMNLSQSLLNWWLRFGTRGRVGRRHRRLVSDPGFVEFQENSRRFQSDRTRKSPVSFWTTWLKWLRMR